MKSPNRSKYHPRPYALRRRCGRVYAESTIQSVEGRIAMVGRRMTATGRRREGPFNDKKKQ